MKLIETHISATTIHVWLADDPELQKAKEWMEVEVALSSFPRSLKAQSLMEIQCSVLGHVQAAIQAELQQLTMSEDRPTSRPRARKAGRLVGHSAS